MVNYYVIIPAFFRTAPHGGVIVGLKMLKPTGIYSVKTS